MTHKRIVSRRSSFLSLAVVMVLGCAAISRAETPRLAAWHSMEPLDLSLPACLQRAVDGLGMAGLANVRTQDGWTASATSSNLHAAISCVSVAGGGVLVDVQVAGDASSPTETSRARDLLRQQMLGQASSPGGPPGSSPWGDEVCFERHPRHLLPGHNLSDQGLRAEVDVCLRRCRADAQCKGVDYNLETGKCFMQAKDRTEIALEPSDTYDHYENTCRGVTEALGQPTGCFRLFSDFAIPGHNVETLTTSLQSCKEECRKRPWCKSLDYEAGGRRCYLQNVVGGDIGGLTRDGRYDHYQRECD